MDAVTAIAKIQSEATPTTVHLFQEHPGKGCAMCGKTRGTNLHAQGSRRLFDLMDS